MHMASQVSSIEPKVLAQRQTPITLRRGVDIRLIIAGAIPGDILKPILRRGVNDTIEKGIGVKQQRLGPRVRSLERSAVVGEDAVPPADHCGVWASELGGFDCVGRGAVDGWEIHEEEVAVAGVVDWFHGRGEHDVDEGVVEGGKVDVVGLAVAHIVDADPECHEGRGRGDEAVVREGGLGVGQELLGLVYQRHGVVVVEWCAGRWLSVLAALVRPLEGTAYYCVDISAPPNAKSHSCFAHDSGEVNPGFDPHPVRNSTQFGPPSAVLV